MAALAGVKTRRFVVWLLSLLLAAGLVAWLLYSQDEPGLELDIAQVGVDVALEDVHLVQGEAGQVQWVLDADLATYVKDASLARLVQPRFTFFTDEANQTVQVRAPLGEVEQDKDNVRLWPEVTAAYAEYLFRSDEVDYQGGTREVVFSGNVRITRPGMSFASEQARLALDTRRISASGNVRVMLSQETLNE